MIGHFWRPDEDAILIEHFNAGVLMKEIARLLSKHTGREVTSLACSKRAKRLKLERPAVARFIMRQASRERSRNKRRDHTFAQIQEHIRNTSENVPVVLHRERRAEDHEDPAVAEFLRTRGVVVCPPVACAPTTATLGDRAVIASYVNSVIAGWGDWKTMRGKVR